MHQACVPHTISYSGWWWPVMGKDGTAISEGWPTGRNRGLHKSQVVHEAPRKHHHLVWPFPGQYPCPHSNASLRVHAPDHHLWGYTKAPQGKVNYCTVNPFTRCTHAQAPSQENASPGYNTVSHLPEPQSVQSELGHRPMRNFYHGFVWKLQVLESDIMEPSLLEEWWRGSLLSSQILFPHVHNNNTHFTGMFWELNAIMAIKYLIHSQCK